MADTKADVQGAELGDGNYAPEVVGSGYPPSKRTFLGNFGAHYKKWWWAHLVAFVIVILVVALPVIYVGYPRIAQNDVNDSTLNITQLVIYDPTPNSIHVNQTQVLGNKATYHPTIYSFNSTISLVGAAAPIATALVPQIQANNGEMINVDQILDLSDSSAMAEFSTAMLNNEEVSLNFYGRPELKEGSLPKNVVTFNKTVTMKGLNGLKGFAITHFNISLSQGIDMYGTVYIPNPSVLTVSMGNVTLDLSVNGTNIGQSFINDLTLVPGNNTLPISSNVNQTLVLKLLPEDGVLPIDITGNKSVYNGQEIPYFSAALGSNKLTANLNITAAL